MNRRILLTITFLISVVYVGGQFPLLFACITLVLALAVGISLERRRLTHEWSFFTGKEPALVDRPTIFLWSLVAAIATALVSGLSALFTFPVLNECRKVLQMNCTTVGWDFSGVEEPVRLYIAICFAAIILVGVYFVRRQSSPLRWGGSAFRWAFFRMAAALGFLYSTLAYIFFRHDHLGLQYSEILKATAQVFGMINDGAEISGLVYTISQFDEITYKLTVFVLNKVFQVPEILEIILAILLSSDILQGFVITVYVYICARMVGEVG